MAARERLLEMVGTGTGLFTDLLHHPRSPGDAEICVSTARVGRPLTMELPPTGAPAQVDGSGSAVTHELSELYALAEALERYSSGTWDPAEVIVAPASELGDTALCLDSLPRCSQRELADPRCPLCNPNKNEPIRWVRGISLTRRAPTWIPLIITRLFVAPWPSESFALPISIGAAAHTDAEIAVLSGLSRIASIVMCATDPDPTRAAVKVIKETAASRIALEGAAESGRGKTSSAEFESVFDGALYMAAPERSHAFSFLGSSGCQGTRRKLSALPTCKQRSPRETLANLVDRLSSLGMEAYVVDLTTPEARAAGLTVIKALVPGLQPLSFATRAQFKGHPRLYRAPLAMGYEARAEDALNPDPQPFA